MYRLFSSKRGILKALLDVSIVGDDEATPMPDRPQVRSLLADPDPKHQLAGLAGITAAINSRIASVYRILVSAAGSDPDAAALLDELTRQRQRGQSLVTRSLAAPARYGPRCASVTPPTSSTPSCPRSCTGCSSSTGGGADRYQQWLTGIVIDQLLAETS